MQDDSGEKTKDPDSIQAHEVYLEWTEENEEEKEKKKSMKKELSAGAQKALDSDLDLDSIVCGVEARSYIMVSKLIHICVCRKLSRS